MIQNRLHLLGKSRSPHVDRGQVVKIAREFAQNAIDTDGRSMIIVGAGINHWFNSDTIYRAVLNLVLLVGAQGVNGGGWAHYVGQEKLRPAEGWQTIAMAKDWGGPAKLQNGTSFFYFATDQWRYEDEPISNLASPITGTSRYKHHADYNVLAARLGWLPSYPTFEKNGIDLYKEAEQSGARNVQEVGTYIAKQLEDKKLKFSIEDPDNEKNFPRNLFVWRANLISSSGKGHEYFLKHLLGTTNGLMNEDHDSIRPEEITWRDKAPEGKLDLLINLDFRMASTRLCIPTLCFLRLHGMRSTISAARICTRSFIRLTRRFQPLGKQNLTGTSLKLWQKRFPIWLRKLTWSQIEGSSCHSPAP